MSSTGHAPIRLEAAMEHLPAFNLDYGGEDPQEPEEITIYDPLAPDVTTRGLTANTTAAVDLADVA